MLLGYDPNKQIVLDPSIYSRDFLDYMNEYIAHIRKRGAKAYYTFPPMNSTALAPADDESILEFYRSPRECRLRGHQRYKRYQSGKLLFRQQQLSTSRQRVGCARRF